MKKLELFVIPKGYYCYEIREIVRKRDGKPVIKTRVCPYLVQRTRSVYCKYFEKSSKDFQYSLLEDSIKLCNINIGDENE